MTRLSRRRLLQLSTMAGATALGGAACGSADPRLAAATSPEAAARVTAPPPDGVLGANFNGDPRVMTFGELTTAGATWLRGFLPMPRVDDGDPAADPTVSTLLRASGQGYGTVLSLKFPYAPKPLPRPGSAAMNAELARLDKVLPLVLDKIDILVLGNEPFIESTRDDWANGALNAFYEAVADHVVKYRAAHSPGQGKTSLYMGALNHLDEPAWRVAATERWLTHVRTTPELAGTDIHPHLADPGGGAAYLDYVLPKLGPDKKFLATEFSLVLFWKKHLTGRVSAEYASKYHVAPGTQVWQVIKDALAKPFPQDQWDDFLRTSPWFENNKNFLTEQTQKFRATGKLAFAGYGIGQDAAMSGGFGPDKTPWLLNSLFATHTVQPLPNGTAAPNYAWLPEFQALQHK
ncbi:hypothetical protein [Amycolatopsis saalfeldensis]|uniref:Uncharacterized protein n=1 Tax=Amycolatopsis saalfeldensis TaxID=394193 RepID=A0A1H8RPG8_9PSEU|nr:hypothetical protein [Amycolatopsis saalfeldensis]SEO67843.1 hypothetical protein SAMN04489732_101873 [Amycolatopsis saalfeldensis]